MHRHRSLLPILRCPHSQCRSAATAAKLKVGYQFCQNGHQVNMLVDSWSGIRVL
jgi:hypothetical protein